MGVRTRQGYIVNPLKPITNSDFCADGLSEAEALELVSIPPEDVFDLFPTTRRARQAVSGDKVYLCSIVNAKSGRCGEDCRFCAQSARYRTEVDTYPLISEGEILEAARAAKGSGAVEFSIVTSGKGVSEPEEVLAIESSVSGIAGLGMGACISPGIVSRDDLKKWVRAGLTKFHHNLETARSFFPEVCTTHDYEEDIRVVKEARELGLDVCCGGIFGLGESWEQRVELAMTLRELDVSSVPINFLNPVKGTPIAETAPGISALDCLKTIALFRLVLPKARIIICGGREVNLRGLQAFIFEAGANGMMIGNYLTTMGRPPEEDLMMIKDLGLEAAPL